MSKGGIWTLFAVSSPFDTGNGLVTSPVVSPLILAVIRLTLALYTLVQFIVDLALTPSTATVDPSTHLSARFSYFTVLSYIGIIAYFWASGVQSAFYVWGRKTQYPLQQWPRILQFLHMLLYSTITTYPILVTIVFWALLRDSDTFSTRLNTWLNISEHALNTVFALFEIFLTHGGPMPWIHVLFLDLMLAGYLGIAYITHKTQGFYPYTFLDPKEQGKLLAAYIVGIAVAEILIFIIVRYACVLRERLSRRYLTSQPPPAPEAIDEWEEITPAYMAI
ncbi:hypothetical protein EUX98_g1042 [Antrodiella citrinella]|uniref:Uncharacterized protein n=1 Tax=Antrodiella citrinella TaxID=2447956 RepID=A0A4S4N5L2_9APHY|nr:hypothetical protein EUX98_g1042 [Antrodiella citrinella]